ncbi:MAG: PilZ domain-containing protein [Acidobacteriota bacterium]
MNRERRKSPRYRVGKILGSILFRADARVQDVSVAGMKVVTNTQLRVGRPCIVSLGGGRGMLQLSGSVVRCVLRGTQRNEKGESELVYEAGISFQGMSDETAAMLRNFLQESVQIDMDRKVSGRFMPDRRNEASSIREQSFQVCALCLAGMRVVTSGRPMLGPVPEIELNLGHHGTVRSHARVQEVPAARGPENEHTFDVEFLNMGADSRNRLGRFITDSFSGPAS